MQVEHNLQMATVKLWLVYLLRTANANRYVVVALRTRNTTQSEDANPASVTVAGQSCSLVVFTDNTGGTTGVGNPII
jgi:hypothetical protein